ncbi:hypothetical protein ACUM6W_02750 [Acinetobacter tandoii]|uniref:hypothetical protein n=1 Tax=Acinetobacter tandoii TaxID=202954 RepID=UPI004045CAB2
MSDISIIVLVIAWAILIAGFVAFIEKFYPKVLALIFNGKINYLWLYGIIFGTFIFLTYPYYFNLLAKYFWNVPADVIDDYTKLGALGDIYGSLNTLFTSATLIIVIYSTLLQRQANIDAREAMADQLQQAKNATAEQLEQAKESSEEQLKQAREALDAQLEQAKQASADQLALAQATHEAQMKESRYSIFSNMFYALLNQKQSCFDNMKLEDEHGQVITANKMFYLISIEFFNLLGSDWKDISLVSKEQVWSGLNSFVKKTNNNQTYTELYSYLGYYSSLLNLISRSEIDEEDKIHFRDILKVSIPASEKITYLWAATHFPELRNSLIGTGLIELKFNEKAGPFMIKFFEQSCFSHPKTLEHWDK